MHNMIVFSFENQELFLFSIPREGHYMHFGMHQHSSFANGNESRFKISQAHDIGIILFKFHNILTEKLLTLYG